jgi:hypothetical protein
MIWRQPEPVNLLIAGARRQIAPVADRTRDLAPDARGDRSDTGSVAPRSLTGRIDV